uniref:Uncharacterized protein n=1 Tax=Solanum lycopersicum TaxID=4081 RepID=K4D0I8_SOLLC
MVGKLQNISAEATSITDDTISKRGQFLANLQDNKGNFTLIYDHSGLPFQDLIIDFINEAVNRLTNLPDFLYYLVKHALNLPEELPILFEDHAANER